MQRVIPPGSAIGILGSGQLGRMFAMHARRMGYHCHTFSPENDTPMGQCADREWCASYDDLDAVRAFAKSVSVVSFEFENVPADTTHAAEEFCPVRPHGSVLHTTQNRLREKGFLREIGVPTTPFSPVRSLEDLEAALDALGTPAILKTAGWGYDGKGQQRINSREEAAAAFAGLGGEEGILEAMVNFTREVSVVGARALDGSFGHYGLMENIHRDHILDLTISPARLPQSVAREATQMAEAILEALDVVGVLCVEFFVKADGSILVNELAPRPHNSGHVTFDTCVTSQFEQQLRAICGLPLGDTTRLRPGVMANLLGDLWADGEPNWTAALQHPNLKLHLYGKAEARPGRKMGHMTAIADTVDEALAVVTAARDALRVAPADRSADALKA